MYKIIESLQKFLKPYYLYIITIIISLIFLYGGYQAYLMYGKQVLEDKKFKDVANANNRKGEAEIIFFWANWCPHCNKAKPEWDVFAQSFNNKTINGHKLTCTDHDCSSTSDKTENLSNDESNVQYLLNKYKIEGFPTIKLRMDGPDGENVIEYDSKVTKKGLETFINSMLN
jgi:thiol-disulfide isomerase/thioredoxin